MPDLLSRTETDEAKLIADPSNIDRYQGLNFILGSELLDKIKNCKLFMIGAGAIGCELLKNYAMLGLGTGSKG
jgi:molybdopterin/thiamine biosynthesis adenylyltransferase